MSEFPQISYDDNSIFIDGKCFDRDELISGDYSLKDLEFLGLGLPVLREVYGMEELINVLGVTGYDWLNPTDAELYAPMPTRMAD